jgi:hypothetical protein
VSVEDDKHSGRPSTNKTTENGEKIQELINEDHCQTIHEFVDIVGISYGVCQISAKNLNISHTALHHDNAPTHMSLKTIEFVTNNNMVIIPHPPYSSGLAPCDFTLFPKLKMKLKGRHFETVSDIQITSGAQQH